MDVEALKAAAEKADEVCGWYSAGELQSCGLGTYSSDFIALANPAAVLALITALEDATEENADLRRTVQYHGDAQNRHRHERDEARAERDGLQRQVDAVREVVDNPGYFAPNYDKIRAALAAAAPVEGQETPE